MSTLMIFSSCQAQKLNKIYYGVSSDSSHHEHLLEFKTDTTLEISTFPRHMSRQFKLILNYKRTGNTIKIFHQNITQTDSISLLKNRLSQFANNTTFKLDKRAIVDTSSKIVYVIYKDFSKKYFLTYIIDGNIYKKESGLADVYGIIKNNPKENAALRTKLTSLNDSIDNYTIKVYKGFDAYNKFGYNCVFGVIEFQQKN